MPGRGNIPWAETFRAIRASGYDDWLTIEAFGRGLPALAAATKVWRNFAQSPEAVYRDRLRPYPQRLGRAGLGRYQVVTSGDPHIFLVRRLATARVWC
ncbi:MAG: hypothetical protein V9G14_15090 [Cypionkella sp.]